MRDEIQKVLKNGESETIKTHITPISTLQVHHTAYIYIYTNLKPKTYVPWNQYQSIAS